jgi:tetratricopeptide (TPR) repeat protein
MGIALGMSGKQDDAVPYFKKAVQTQGAFFEAYYNLGIIFTKENKIDEAADAWQNVVRIRPKFAQGHENLGYALYAQAKFPESLAELRMALDEEPNRLFALKLAANLLATCPDSAVRNGPEALSLAEKAKQLSGGNDPGILDTLSAAYAETGRFDEALAAEQQAAAIAEQEGDAALESSIKDHVERYESKEPLREAPSRTSF